MGRVLGAMMGSWGQPWGLEMMGGVLAMTGGLQWALGGLWEGVVSLRSLENHWGGNQEGDLEQP